MEKPIEYTVLLDLGSWDQSVTVRWTNHGLTPKEAETFLEKYHCITWVPKRPPAKTAAEMAEESRQYRLARAGKDE